MAVCLLLAKDRAILTPPIPPPQGGRCERMIQVGMAGRDIGKILQRYTFTLNIHDEKKLIIVATWRISSHLPFKRPQL
jgi:hypothetical protein